MCACITGYRYAATLANCPWCGTPNSSYATEHSTRVASDAQRSDPQHAHPHSTEAR